MNRLQRYYVPSGSGVAPHGCGALYKKADVDARISALEAALAKADELAEACDALHSQAHKSMTGGHGHMIDDAAHALTTYRQARDATR